MAVETTTDTYIPEDWSDLSHAKCTDSWAVRMLYNAILERFEVFTNDGGGGYNLFPLYQESYSALLSKLSFKSRQGLFISRWDLDLIVDALSWLVGSGLYIRWPEEQYAFGDCNGRFVPVTGEVKENPRWPSNTFSSDPKFAHPVPPWSSVAATSNSAFADWLVACAETVKQLRYTIAFPIRFSRFSESQYIQQDLDIYDGVITSSTNYTSPSAVELDDKPFSLNYAGYEFFGQKLCKCSFTYTNSRDVTIVRTDDKKAFDYVPHEGISSRKKSEVFAHSVYMGNACRFPYEAYIYLPIDGSRFSPYRRHDFIKSNSQLTKETYDGDYSKSESGSITTYIMRKGSWVEQRKVEVFSSSATSSEPYTESIIDIDGTVVSTEQRSGMDFDSFDQNRYANPISENYDKVLDTYEGAEQDAFRTGIPLGVPVSKGIINAHQSRAVLTFTGPVLPDKLVNPDSAEEQYHKAAIPSASAKVYSTYNDGTIKQWWIESQLSTLAETKRSYAFMPMFFADFNVGFTYKDTEPREGE